MNFFRVSGANVYRGPKPRDLDQMEEIRSFGVKTIVDIEEGWSDVLGLSLGYKEEGLDAELRGINYIPYPLSNFRFPSNEQLTRVVDLVYAKQLKGAVYVHCYAGVDRTGVTIACYRVRYQKWTPEKAWGEMCDYGHHRIRYFWWKRKFFEYCQTLT